MPSLAAAELNAELDRHLHDPTIAAGEAWVRETARDLVTRSARAGGRAISRVYLIGPDQLGMIGEASEGTSVWGGRYAQIKVELPPIRDAGDADREALAQILEPHLRELLQEARADG